MMRTFQESYFRRVFWVFRTRFFVFESMIFWACFLISSRVSIWTSSSPELSSSERSPGARVAWAPWIFYLRTKNKGLRNNTTNKLTGDLIVENGEISSTRLIAHWVRSFPAFSLAPWSPSSPRLSISWSIRPPERCKISLIWATRSTSF